MTSLVDQVTQGSWVKFSEDAQGALVVLKPDHTFVEYPLFPKWDTYTDESWKADIDWPGPPVNPAHLPEICDGQWHIGSDRHLFMEVGPFVLEVPLGRLDSSVYGGREWCRHHSSLHIRYILVHNTGGNHG